MVNTEIEDIGQERNDKIGELLERMIQLEQERVAWSAASPPAIAKSANTFHGPLFQSYSASLRMRDATMVPCLQNGFFHVGRVPTLDYYVVGTEPEVIMSETELI